MNRRAFSIASAASAIGIWTWAAASDYLDSEEQPLEECMATPDESLEVVDEDLRNVLARPWMYEDRLIQFSALIDEMRVGSPGNGFRTGDEDAKETYRTQCLTTVTFPDANEETVLVVFNDDVPDIHQDDTVMVTGTFGGEHWEDAGGGYWDWPFVVAVKIEKVDPSTPAV